MGRTNLNANFARSVSAFRKACDENLAASPRAPGLCRASAGGGRLSIAASFSPLGNNSTVSGH